MSNWDETKGRVKEAAGDLTDDKDLKREGKVDQASGKAKDKMKKVFDIVHQAQTAALKAARPGVPLEAIDAAGRKIVVDNGYGPGFKYFTHRLGHGMGMDGHEWPYLVKNNMFGWEKALTLQPGMVFSDEPGIYIKGEFGVRLEDDMHITENGAELFTPQSPSIEEPFGA